MASVKIWLKCSWIGQRWCQKCVMWKGSKKICFCFKSKQLKRKGKTRDTFSRGLLSSVLPLDLSISWDRPRPTTYILIGGSVVGLKFSHYTVIQILWSQVLPCWPCSYCIQHYKGQLSPLISLVAKAFLVLRIHPTGCTPFRNKNRKSGPSLKIQFEGLNFSSDSWNQSSQETSEFPFRVSNYCFWDLGKTHTQSSKLQHKVSKSGGMHKPFWI